MKDKHYHYLVVFERNDGMSNRFYKLKNKISRKDIRVFENNFKEDNNINYIPLVSGFFELECDCET